jgi:hypothetical protein
LSIGFESRKTGGGFYCGVVGRIFRWIAPDVRPSHPLVTWITNRALIPARTACQGKHACREDGGFECLHDDFLLLDRTGQLSCESSHSRIVGILVAPSRVLKKSASFVLASFRSSTYRRDFRRSDSLEGLSVRQDPLYGRTAPRSAVGTFSGLHLLRPCWAACLSTLLTI